MHLLYLACLAPLVLQKEGWHLLITIILNEAPNIAVWVLLFPWELALTGKQFIDNGCSHGFLIVDKPAYFLVLTGQETCFKEYKIYQKNSSG